MKLEFNNLKKMPRVHSADGLKSLKKGDFIVLALPTIIESILLVGAELQLKYEDDFEEIKTFRVLSAGKKDFNLEPVNDCDFWVSARAQDRRPVYITGAQALSKRMLGYK